MADVFGGPFGTYADASGGVIDGTGKDEVGVMLTNFCALFGVLLVAGNGVTGVGTIIHNASSPHPDFDNIAIEVREKMAVEMTNLWDAIDAASEA